MTSTATHAPVVHSCAEAAGQSVRSSRMAASAHAPTSVQTCSTSAHRIPAPSGCHHRRAPHVVAALPEFSAQRGGERPDVSVSVQTSARCLPQIPCAPLPLTHTQPRRGHRRGSVACRSASGSKSGISLFPSGAAQATVVLPAIILQVTADALMSDVEGTLDKLSRAVRAGATGVLLSEGSGGGASALYEAAVKLKSLVSGRAVLLVVDRVDIAQAAEADGVVLTESGIPTVVARRMLSGSACGLVGRIAGSADAAAEAAADGANLVLLRGTGGGVPDARALSAARSQQRSGNAIPVLLSAAATATSAQDTDRLSDALGMAARGAGGAGDGVALDLDILAAGVGMSSVSASVEDIVRSAAGVLAGASEATTSTPTARAAAPATNGGARAGTVTLPAAPPRRIAASPGSAGGGTWSKRLVAGSASEQLLSDERDILAEVTAFLEEVVPDLPELVLLRDATRQLDEPFLVVVVGEFNSGKSSVINALLGNKFLAEGILPTTNEISILRFSDEPGAEKRVEQQADGLYVRYLPARLLEELQIVDTPGTNVILERQQRLTEEYVPRADLVLFVMSADRPFSESEVRFLEYIRQWRKKVVFVINKADMLESIDEVEEVKSFVADNARRVLRLDDPPVIAVSSRAAIRAKLAARTPHKGSIAPDINEGALASHPDWVRSGFSAFEHLIYAFLIGGDQGVAGAGEGVRLKLQTPLFVADALVGAAGKKLEQELTAAQAELASVRSINKQLQRFAADMEKDATAQRDALLKVLASVTSRMDGYIDRTLALSNAVALVDYIAGPKSSAAIAKSMAKFEAEAVGFERVRDSVIEHSGWLEANCEAQRAYYRAFVEARAEEAILQGRDMREVMAALAALPPPKTTSSEPNTSASGVAISSGGMTGLSVSSQGEGAVSVGVSGNSSTALSAQEDFDLRAAAALLEDELREAVVGTATTAIGAPALGLVVTSLIDNAFEDLMVLGAASAAAYASVVNLPLRRAEIKGKVAKLASSFVTGVQDRMKQSLDEEVARTVAQIETLAKPLERSAAAEVARLQDLETARARIVKQLSALGQRAANLE